MATLLLLPNCSRVFLKTLRKSIFADNSRGGSRTAATPKMECFVIILNSWKPLTIITKLSIFDVATVLDPPLSSFFSNFHRFGKETLNVPESIREKSHLVRIYLPEWIFIYQDNFEYMVEINVLVSIVFKISRM